jgi:hypothetical protein
MSSAAAINVLASTAPAFTASHNPQAFT